jgi:hypothetical protein
VRVSADAGVAVMPETGVTEMPGRIKIMHPAGLLQARPGRATFADTFNWTSDDCTGGCNPSGTVTVTQTGNTLSFTANLGDSLEFLGANGAGIGTTFAFDLTGISNVTFSAITDGTQTYAPNASSPTSIMMDGAGTFNFGVRCTTCGPGGSNPDGNSISFSISGTGLTLANLTTGSGGSFFAADVISCKTGVTSCTGTGTGNTGVIDATRAVPGPIAGAGLPGVVAFFGGLNLARARHLTDATTRRQSRGCLRDELIGSRSRIAIRTLPREGKSAISFAGCDL